MAKSNCEFQEIAMMKKVAVVRERFPHERRVALLPENVEKLKAAGYEVLVEYEAGKSAGISDQLYEEAGATLTDRRGLAGADVLVQVRSLGANVVNGTDDLELIRSGHLVIGMCDPLGNTEAIQELASHGVSQIALEMVPRITKAQSMDVLSSMATIAGYRAVLHAAYRLPRMFPLNMTAAGTLAAAKVFIIGAGVAGLQAAATAKRLGAIVSAFDVRPDCREQVESVGARFVEFELESENAEDAGGYARQQTEEFLNKQREFMAEVASEHDIVITTAAIPGRQSPLLLTTEAVKGMVNGSVIVDLAAERGGNCSETQADETIVVDGVTILGPTNLPSEIPYHASQMFGNNVTTLLLYLLNEDCDIELDLTDDVLAGCLVSKNGQIVNERIGDLLGMETIPSAEEDPKVTEQEEYELETGGEALNESGDQNSVVSEKPEYGEDAENEESVEETADESVSDGDGELQENDEEVGCEVELQEETSLEEEYEEEEEAEEEEAEHEEGEYEEEEVGEEYEEAEEEEAETEAEYEIEDYDAKADYTDDEDPDFDFSDYEAP